MSKPTREQIARWWADSGPGVKPVTDRIEHTVALAYAAGRNAGMEEAALMCLQASNAHTPIPSLSPTGLGVVISESARFFQARELAVAISDRMVEADK